MKWLVAKKRGILSIPDARYWIPPPAGKFALAESNCWGQVDWNGGVKTSHYTTKMDLDFREILIWFIRFRTTRDKIFLYLCLQFANNSLLNRRWGFVDLVNIKL